MCYIFITKIKSDYKLGINKLDKHAKFGDFFPFREENI